MKKGAEMAPTAEKMARGGADQPPLPPTLLDGLLTRVEGVMVNDWALPKSRPMAYPWLGGSWCLPIIREQDQFAVGPWRSAIEGVMAPGKEMNNEAWSHVFRTRPNTPGDKGYDLSLGYPNQVLEVRESSSAWSRCLCVRGCRAVDYGVFEPLNAVQHPTGWPEGVQPLLHVRRPWTVCCGAVALGPRGPALPAVAVRTQTQGLLGRAVLQWDWLCCLWPCSVRYRLEDSQGNTSGYADVNRFTPANCCAPSIWNYVQTIPVKDVRGGEVVGGMERHYGLSPIGEPRPYLVKFPPEATAEMRAVLFATVFLIHGQFPRYGEREDPSTETRLRHAANGRLRQARAGAGGAAR